MRFRKLWLLPLALLSLLLAIQSLRAADVKLAWDANTETDLAGYKVYYGSASRSYSTSLDAGNQTTYTVTNLNSGIFFFAVTAYNTSGMESGYSNEVSQAITNPINPIITFVATTAISTTEATISWTTDPECSGQVLYGTDPTRWLALPANNLATTDHLVRVQNLISRTHYFYKVASTCSGVPVESGIRSFNTK